MSSQKQLSKRASLPDELNKYAKYKWEFLRRNPEFISDYEEMQKEIEEEYEDGRFPNVYMLPEEIKFCSKWKIANTMDPYNSFDDYKNFWTFTDNDIKLTKNLRRFLIEPKKLLFQWLYPEFLPGRPIIRHDLEITDKLGDTGRIKIEIDFNYSKKFLKEQLKFFVDEWKALYEEIYKEKIYNEFCKEKGIHSLPIQDDIIDEFNKVYKKRIKKRNQKYGKKYHFDNFDLYLQVYDLRKEGKSWSKITSMLDLNSVQTARNHYNAACEIIEKGIELYVK